MKERNFAAIIITILSSGISRAQSLITGRSEGINFPIVVSSEAIPVCVNSNDNLQVPEAVYLKHTDNEMVTGEKPEITSALHRLQQILLLPERLMNLTGKNCRAALKIFEGVTFRCVSETSQLRGCIYNNKINNK